MEARPPQISWFIGLQCAGLALAALKLRIDWGHLKSLASVDKLIFTNCSTIAILAFLIWKVSAGRNWARITLLVFFLIGVLPFAFILRREFVRSVGLASISIVQMAVQASSLVVVFTSSANVWFRSQARQPVPLH